MTTKEIGVFIQGAKQNGSHMILDLENTPLDPANVLLGCYKLFGHVIVWSKTHPEKLEPIDFRFGRVTQTASRGDKGDSRTDTWRIAFKVDNTKLAGWRYVKSAGIHGTRGEVSITEPPFCNKCISRSHDWKHCEWFSNTQLTSNNAKPRDFIPMRWTEHKSFEPEATKLKETGGEVYTPKPPVSGPMEQSQS